MLARQLRAYRTYKQAYGYVTVTLVTFLLLLKLYRSHNNNMLAA